MTLADFRNDLAGSKGFDPQVEHALRVYLGGNFLSYTANENDVELDKKGVDAWVDLVNGRRNYIDYKADRKDSDTICLELWSNEERGVPGWSVDNSKLTDYVVYLKTKLDYALVFHFHAMQAFLRDQCQNNASDILRRLRRVPNKGYTTAVVFYSRTELEQALGHAVYVPLTA